MHSVGVLFIFIVQTALKWGRYSNEQAIDLVSPYWSTKCTNIYPHRTNIVFH